MIYADLLAGASVFVDASVFIHHFEPNPQFGVASTEFLERIENQEISGFTTTHILSEVAHRLMTIEAMQTFGWKSAGIALRLRNHPREVQTLKRFRQAIQEIPHFGLTTLAIDLSWLDPPPRSANKPASCTMTRSLSRPCTPTVSSNSPVPTLTSTACPAFLVTRRPEPAAEKVPITPPKRCHHAPREEPQK